jgi:hypothetical protein
VVAELLQHRTTFAIAGRLAASLYRVKSRLTPDVGVALTADDVVRSRERAVVILRALGHETALATTTNQLIDLAGSRPC